MILQHFVCAKCEKPFLGTKHFEKKGLAYCELHYHQLFGNIDFVSGEVIEDSKFQWKSPVKVFAGKRNVLV